MRINIFKMMDKTQAHRVLKRRQESGKDRGLNRKEDCEMRGDKKIQRSLKNYTFESWIIFFQDSRNRCAYEYLRLNPIT
jgi:hypothetical protein